MSPSFNKLVKPYHSHHESPPIAFEGGIGREGMLDSPVLRWFEKVRLFVDNHIVIFDPFLD